jgi:hypothetical protein
MLLTSRIKFVLSEDQTTGLTGVKVSLFDRDLKDEDDFLATGTTDAQGEILFRFDSEQYMDEEDRPLWQKESLPDLYIVAYDSSGKEVFSTRSEAVQDKLIRTATFPFTKEQALEYGWIST